MTAASSAPAPCAHEAASATSRRSEAVCCSRSFSLSVDGQEQLNGLGSALRFDADHLIAHLSNYHTVRNGDLLLLGAPAAELLIHPEKRVETYLNGECPLFQDKIKKTFARLSH